jgi:hypothetical protein
LLQLELQQKSSSIFTKVRNKYNKNSYVCKQSKVVKQQLICYRLNYNKSRQQFFTKVTNNYNKKWCTNRHTARRERSNEFLRPTHVFCKKNVHTYFGFWVLVRFNVTGLGVGAVAGLGVGGLQRGASEPSSSARRGRDRSLPRGSVARCKAFSLIQSREYLSQDVLIPFFPSP